MPRRNENGGINLRRWDGSPRWWAEAHASVARRMLGEPESTHWHAIARALPELAKMGRELERLTDVDREFGGLLTGSPGSFGAFRDPDFDAEEVEN